MSSLAFPCGGGCTLVVRDNLHELETAAKKFEQEGGLLEELLQSTGNEDLHLLSTMFPIAEDIYFPYCDINFEAYPDYDNTSDPFKNSEFVSEDSPIASSIEHIANSSDTPLSCAASTLCSFRVNDSTHPDNVRLSYCQEFSCAASTLLCPSSYFVVLWYYLLIWLD